MSTNSMLQPRPISTLPAAGASGDEWNDSLTGDFLWSNVNISEALPDVMTPLTWSLARNGFGMLTVLPGCPVLGNVGGRAYYNLSALASAIRAAGKNVQDSLREFASYEGPSEEAALPLLAVPRSALFAILRNAIRIQLTQAKALAGLRAYLARNPGWCQAMQARARVANSGNELAELWAGEVASQGLANLWRVFATAARYVALAGRLRRDLSRLVGDEVADALLSSVSHDSELLASLGPVVGIWQVFHEEMTREAFLADYGHRGPHEAELFYSRPVEEPGWLDQQLAALARDPVDVEALRAQQRAAFEVAWDRFRATRPREAKAMAPRLKAAAEAARLREAARSEYMRTVLVTRTCALRAGEVTGLGEDTFFLTHEENLALLYTGHTEALQHIPARRAAFEFYRALPPYPPLIRGRFDPAAWATDPNRRTDFFDGRAPRPRARASAEADRLILGSPGSAGRAEGRVRRLDRPEDGDQLLKGEILVAVQTNVGWTPLFPRAAAVVTDVGAPLSHAAIVARELGIPAVVGCRDATARLRTGDRVRVDGGRGSVEILEA